MNREQSNNTVEGSAVINSEMLLRFAHDKSESGKVALVEAVTNLTLSSDDELKSRERQLIFEILAQLVHETEMSVRCLISAHLAEIPDAPHDLIRILADDEIEIAYPILSCSTVLEDTDLIEIIKNRTTEHQLGIAIRRNVGESVSGALVAGKNRSVIKCLLENTGANISPETMETLVELSENEDSLHEPIVNRRDLGPDLAQRMFLWVSEALRSALTADWGFSPELVDSLLLKAQEHETKLLGIAPKSHSVRLAEKLAQQGLMSPHSLLRVLRSGEIALFVAMLHVTTKLPETFVRKLVFDPKGLGLAVLCKSFSVSREVFGAIFTLTRREDVRDTSLQFRYQFILEYYDGLTEHAALDLTRTWRNHPNPSGIWNLGLTDTPVIPPQVRFE